MQNPKRGRSEAPAAAGSAGKIPRPPASPYDPEGSYTGRPLDPSERPVQDADDL